MVDIIDAIYFLFAKWLSDFVVAVIKYAVSDADDLTQPAGKFQFGQLHGNVNLPEVCHCAPSETDDENAQRLESHSKHATYCCHCMCGGTYCANKEYFASMMSIT